MKRNNIVCAIHHILLAIDDLDDWNRDHPNSKGSLLFLGYIKKMNWILEDLKTHPNFMDAVREGLKREMTSDVQIVPGIHELIGLLPPELRPKAEGLLETMVKEYESQSKQIKE